MATPQPQSEFASMARAWVGFALLLIAQFGVRPLFSTRANVDFLIIAILFAAVRVRPGVAAILGLLAGLTIDALAPSAFGAATLAYIGVAFMASRVKAVFFADHIALTGLFVFIGKLAYDALYVVLSGGNQWAGLVIQLLLWTPLSAALTAGVSILLLTVFRPLYRPSTR